MLSPIRYKDTGQPSCNCIAWTETTCEKRIIDRMTLRELDQETSRDWGATVVVQGCAGTDEAFVPATLRTYLSLRSRNVDPTLRSLSALVPGDGLWLPIAATQAEKAGLSPCPFDGALLLRRRGSGLSAIITAEGWSVTLIDAKAWVEVPWPWDSMLPSLEGRLVRSQIDFPFLSPTLRFRGHEAIGALTRFFCREDG